MITAALWHWGGLTSEEAKWYLSSFQLLVAGSQIRLYRSRCRALIYPIKGIISLCGDCVISLTHIKLNITNVSNSPSHLVGCSCPTCWLLVSITPLRVPSSGQIFTLPLVEKTQTQAWGGISPSLHVPWRAAQDFSCKLSQNLSMSTSMCLPTKTTQSIDRVGKGVS